MTHWIDFQPVGRRDECPEGATLLECARRLGVGLVNLCGGTGSCGRCVVQVLAGAVSEPGPGEVEVLADRGLASGYRLACRTIPLGDCTIRIPPESLTAPQRTQVEGEELDVALDPLVRCFDLTLSPPDVDDLLADAERITGALAQQHGVECRIEDLTLLRDISPWLREHSWQVRAVVRGDKVVALLPYGSLPLGLAVDLGTTKIAAYLVDMETGQTLASQGIMNPQIAYGEDVIARMAYSRADPVQAAQLQGLVVDALNKVVGEMCERVEMPSSNVVEASNVADASAVVEGVVVGNTAMHHLFLGLPVEQMALAPYVPAVASPLDIRSSEFGLCLARGAVIHLLPNIAGYVGADHVAALLATGLDREQGVVLLVDIGTNTEVCLVSGGVLASTSCASGPAFEGAHIKYGMRAAHGAIEHMRLANGEVEYQTIGGGPPVGLCGSGILDAMAQLYLAGILDRGGRMGLHERVRDREGASGRPVREFVLVEGEDRGEDQQAITFTQKDVRQVQLAKGAMRTGIDVLLETCGLGAGDIDQVIIAGAFGTYINVSSAISIGMLPDLPLDRFRQVGNAAGMGAKMALISRTQREEAAALARRVRYVDLTARPHFANLFARSMYLGQ